MALALVCMPVTFARKTGWRKAALLLGAMAALWVASLSGQFGWEGIVLLLVIFALALGENLHGMRRENEATEKVQATRRDKVENVLKFLHLVSCPEGINIGQRHISLSTSGIADKIERLAGEKLQITLSISLHAPDNETRSSIMPVNDAYPVERLMRACRYYFDTTGRRISYEYMMARDKTDRPWQAEQLTKLLRGRPAHVNLIPLNEVAESPLRPSRPETVRRFQQALEKRGVTATVRRKLGPDIDAACGQLRRRELQKQQN